MLSISKQQKKAIIPDELWVTDLCSHIRNHHRAAVSGIDDDALRATVKNGLERARAHGLSHPSTIAFFIILLVEIGPDFDKQPRIAEILSGSEGTPDERLAELVPRLVQPKPKPEPTLESKLEPKAEPTDTVMQEADEKALQEADEKAFQEAAELFRFFYQAVHQQAEDEKLGKGIRVTNVVQFVEEDEWKRIWKEAAATSHPSDENKTNFEPMDIVANAVDSAIFFKAPENVQSCVTKPKLQEKISALFIPFEAAIQHYKRNATNGVDGFAMVQGADGKLEPYGGKSPVVQDFVAPGEFIEGVDITEMLSDIVTTECENIRLQYGMDEPLDSRFVEGMTEGQRKVFKAHEDALKWRQAGYQHYPTILILSENPTKIVEQDPKSKKSKKKRAEFPLEIDTGVSKVKYVRQLALDKSNVKGIKPVNEMAVYVRKDFQERAEKSGELSLSTKVLIRHTSGLEKGGKEEYMVQVTISQEGYTPISLVGVHLRATLTSVTNQSALKNEVAALQDFCEKNGIDALVGDFNFDVTTSSQGFRGVYTQSKATDEDETKLENRLKRTEYLAPPIPEKKEANPSTAMHARVPQQFSNSANNAHYMGIFLANSDAVRLSGPGMIGLQGASGSRTLLERKGKKKQRYYSDHPSMYLGLEAANPPNSSKKRKSFDSDAEDDSPLKRRRR